MTAPFDSVTRERATFYLIFTLFCIDNLVFLIICIIFPAIFFFKFLCLLNISLITIINLRNHYSKPSFSIVLLNAPWCHRTSAQHRGPHRGATVLFACRAFCSTHRGPHRGATVPLPNTVDYTVPPPCFLPAVPFAQRTVTRRTVALLQIKLNWNLKFQFAKFTSDSANLCISKFPQIELSLNFQNLVL